MHCVLKLQLLRAEQNSLNKERHGSDELKADPPPPPPHTDLKEGVSWKERAGMTIWTHSKDKEVKPGHSLSDEDRLESSLVYLSGLLH